MWIDDQVIEKSGDPFTLSMWQPQDTFVVLGSGNQLDLECRVDSCVDHRLKVYRRYGGGGAVVLHPGCLIVSLGTWVKELYQNDFYFDLINQALISTLGSRWPILKDLYQDGISDLVFRGKKVMGSSMFRSRNYLLYQASLLFDPKVDEISRFLAHPSKEPGYRKGKKHGDFLTGLGEIVPQMTIQELTKCFVTDLECDLRKGLGDHLRAPCQSQMKNLEKRLGRAPKRSQQGVDFL